MSKDEKWEEFRDQMKVKPKASDKVDPPTGAYLVRWAFYAGCEAAAKALEATGIANFVPAEIEEACKFRAEIDAFKGNK